MADRGSCSSIRPRRAIVSSNWPNCRRVTDMAGFVHPEFLVETGWLEQHLTNANVVVLDCTTHLIPNPAITYDVVPGREDFEKFHIKGAQFCDVSRDVSDTSHKFRFMRQTPDDFAAAMRRFGVSDDTKVVLYSTTSP